MPLLTLICVLGAQQVVYHSNKWNWNGVVATLMQLAFWEVFTDLSGLIMVSKWANRAMKCEILVLFFSPYSTGKHALSQHTFWNFWSKMLSFHHFIYVILDCFSGHTELNLEIFGYIIVVICFPEYAEDWH